MNLSNRIALMSACRWVMVLMAILYIASGTSLQRPVAVAVMVLIGAFVLLQGRIRRLLKTRESTHIDSPRHLPVTESPPPRGSFVA